MLFSCADEDTGKASASEETLMTEYSEDLSVVMSQNGRRSYHFVTPLLEGYSQAREPYREFRKGVKITTYKNDSLTTVDAILTANYAIYYTNRELWEAKGNVVVEKSDGKTLYTQQLFWNARTKKIYSNVDSKIVQNNGRDVFIGEGFESDEEFKDWRFRRMKGRMEVEMKQNADSTAADSTAVRRGPQPAGEESQRNAESAKPKPDTRRAEASVSSRQRPVRELPAESSEVSAPNMDSQAMTRQPLEVTDDVRRETLLAQPAEAVPAKALPANPKHEK